MANPSGPPPGYQLNPTLSQRYGFPVATNAQGQMVGMNMSLSGATDPVAQRQEETAALKELTAQRAALQGYAGHEAQLRRFGQLNEQTGTGGALGIIPWGAAIAGRANRDIGDMNAISSGMQFSGAPRGQGPLTDFERKLIARGQPGADQLGTVNHDIINYQLSVLQEARDQNAFKENWLARHHTLNGADAAWGRYTKENPYLVTDKRDLQVLNPNRVDWNDWFSAKTAPLPQQQPTMAAPGRAPPRQAGGGFRILGVE